MWLLKSKYVASREAMHVTGAKDRAELPGWDSGAAPILIQSLHVTGP
jgi:hypothetical protein